MSDMIGATIFQLHAARRLIAMGADPRKLLGFDAELPPAGNRADSRGRPGAETGSRMGEPAESPRIPTLPESR